MSFRHKKLAFINIGKWKVRYGTDLGMVPVWYRKIGMVPIDFAFPENFEHYSLGI